VYNDVEDVLEVFRALWLMVENGFAVRGGDFLMRSFRLGHPLVQALVLRIAGTSPDCAGVSELIQVALRWASEYLLEDVFNLWLQRARTRCQDEHLLSMLLGWLHIPMAWDVLACYADLVAKLRLSFVVPALAAGSSVELQVHRLALLETLYTATGGRLFANDIVALAAPDQALAVRARAQGLLHGNV
jgi:hypothetical protein